MACINALWWRRVNGQVALSNTVAWSCSYLVATSSADFSYLLDFNFNFQISTQSRLTSLRLFGRQLGCFLGNRCRHCSPVDAFFPAEGVWLRWFHIRIHSQTGKSTIPAQVVCSSHGLQSALSSSHWQEQGRRACNPVPIQYMVTVDRPLRKLPPAAAIFLIFFYFHQKQFSYSYPSIPAHWFRDIVLGDSGSLALLSWQRALFLCPLTVERCNWCYLCQHQVSS